MARVVSLFLPTWSIDRVRRKLAAAAPRPEIPFVLACHDGRRRVVRFADQAAQSAKIHAGMPLAKAHLLAPGLIVSEADEDADRQGLRRLALWCLRRYAPVVAVDGIDGVVIEISGAGHLYGGEASMLADIAARLSSWGHQARIAVADTWGVAHAVARYRAERISIVPPGQGVKAILPLPLDALRLSATMNSQLRVLGFAFVGDLLAQPRAPFALRFGPDLLRRLDQATGAVAEPIERIEAEEIIEIRRSFAEPISAAETIARYIGKLSADLCSRLEREELGARLVDLICRRVDKAAQVIRVGVAVPTRDARRMTRLLNGKIEAIEPGYGIEAMALAATAAERLAHAQLAARFAEEETPDIADLIDTFANRLDHSCVYRIAPVVSDLPERSVRRIPALAPDQETNWPSAWPRPARLFPSPEQIQIVALLPDHPPAAFTWRGVRRKVRRADGPERVFGEWWRDREEVNAVRDYFQVEDEAGERYWIFRTGDGDDPATGSQCWFLHGIFA